MDLEDLIEKVENTLNPKSIIYSNLNPDGILGLNGWSINSTQGLAFSFIPEHNYLLTSVELAIQDISKYYPEPYSPEFFVAIYDDNHFGKPDGLLTAEKGIAPYFPYYERPAYNTMVEFSFPIELVAGDLYWIAVHPAEIPADLGWTWNSYGIESTCYNSVPPTLAGGEWSPKGMMVEGAYQLNGTIIE